MKIAILSRNANLYSTARLVEAGRRRGHEIEVIDHLKCAVVNEKANPEVHYNKRVLNDFDGVIPRIGASVTMYGSAVVRQFETMNVFCANNSQSIVRSRDKLRTTQILSMENIGIPRTVFAHDWDDADDLLRSVGGPPVIIKLLEGTQGLGVVLAETKKAAQSVIEAFRALEANILVQEFISEAKGADIRAFVVDGHVVGSMIRQGPDGEFRSNLHRGGHARVYKLSREERVTALRAAKVLGLVVAGVDMLQSARGPLVMEVNSSPGLEGIEGATAVDIAGKIIECVEKYGDRGRGKDKIKL